METTTAETPGPLFVFVPGKPAPQGSKRYLGRTNGRGITVESSKAVAPWRADIREHVLARRKDAPPLAGPVTVELEFVMPRPTSLPKHRTPPHTKRPDADKLTRAVLDALTSAGVYTEDSQVDRLTVRKRYAYRDEAPGCAINIITGATLDTVDVHAWAHSEPVTAHAIPVVDDVAPDMDLGDRGEQFDEDADYADTRRTDQP